MKVLFMLLKPERNYPKIRILVHNVFSDVTIVQFEFLDEILTTGFVLISVKQV